jgi:hypothetical protein
MFSRTIRRYSPEKLKDAPTLQVVVVVLIALALIIVSFIPQVVAYPDATWQGEYYNNKELSGSPVLVLDHGVEALDFYWGFGSPDPLLGNDNFSVRWTRSLNFEGGSYKFYTATDDGVRLWVDDQLLIDQWHVQATQTHVATMDLIEGWHHVKVEYFEEGGVAEARVWWELIEHFPPLWRGEYYDNTGLAAPSKFVRDDGGVLDFDWHFGSPGGGLGNDDFSVRWTRNVDFETGDYNFHVVTDDGVRLWVDDKLVVDEWYDHPAQTYTAAVNLTEGWHRLKMEYYEHGGTAQASLWWERVEAPPYPQWRNQWRGEYYNNTGLNGSPDLVRDDGPDIDVYWGFGSPGGGIGDDNFSVRWTRSMDFEGGLHRFSVTTDDGVRFWLDEQLLVDQWHVQAAQTYTADVTLVEGWHHLKMEYFEDGGVAEAHLSWELVEIAPPEECDMTPILGFGQVWNDNPTVRDGLGCPTEAEKSVQAAEETFEDGYMFWREDLGRIYALYDDSSTWQSFADTWKEGDPESDPAIVPPAGFYQPVRGFGKVWREEPGVRDNLGWATMEERGFSASVQAFEEGLMIWSDSQGIFVLYKDGTWEHYL